jgi:hypothetical protein
MDLRQTDYPNELQSFITVKTEFRHCVLLLATLITSTT